MTSQADHDALDGLWKYVDDENLDWSHEALKFKEDHQSGGPKSESTVSQDMGRSLKLLKVREELSNLGARQAPMVRYPGGFVITGPHISTRDALPRASFDDDFDEHNVDAPARISLSDHLADVAAETRRLVSAINLEAAVAAAVIAAAERHDLGKTDLRFQALLLGSTPDVAAMQPQLWAKSARGFVPTNTHTLPRGFRHEMLSVALAQKVKDELDQDGHDLMLHVIAAHHGHARPFAPVVVDDAPPDVNLGVLSDSKNQKAAILLSCEERRASPAHRLDSGISERFWTLNRRFGWWGLAWLESALRLADWVASAQPIKRISSIHLHAAQDHGAKTTVEQEILLVGIDATNPLAFLAALGVLRTVTAALPDSNVRMAWRSSGKWHPVIVTNCELTRDDLTSLIHEALHGRQNDSHFIDLGKNINVHHSEFRRAVMNSVAAAHMHNRVSADFYSAYGSEALVLPNDLTTIQDTALRTMAGAGHQHFLETMRNLIEACGIGHIEKTLFHPWDYSDPSQTLSLRYDPSDDNRYALRWRNPSGDPARKSSGSMLGANRLAIEALPLFVTAPGASRLQTAGFTGHRSNDTYIHWPLWESLLPLSVVQSLLVLPQVIGGPTSAQQLFDRGVGGVMTSQRITVGKVRNFSQGSPCWSTTSIDRS